MLWWALAEGAVVLWFGLPFLVHRQRCIKAMRSPWTPKMQSTWTPCPTWCWCPRGTKRRSSRRLDNLAVQRIEGHTLREAGVDLMAIDSVSDDGTLEVTEAWLSSNPDAFANTCFCPWESAKERRRRCSGLASIREASPDNASSWSTRMPPALQMPCKR